MDTPTTTTNQGNEKPTARGKATFWDDEIRQSQKFLGKFHKQGAKIVQRFLDDRRDAGDIRATSGFRLNLFNSNIRTMQDMLYSNLPSVSVDRTHADANDDVARVAAETMERLLNTDIADHPKDYDSVLRSALQDRLLPGLGVARVRYEFREMPVTIPPQMAPDGTMLTPPQETTQIVDEKAPVDYYHWQDVLWGWSRCYSEMPWVAFRSYLSRTEAKQRFGAAAAKALQYKKRRAADTEKEPNRPEDNSPWHQAEVWEIWDKVSKKVYWFSPGYEKLLDIKDDPLKLKNFFPCPEFMMANATTTLYRPVSDFHLCQDLYNEIDELQTRISLLTTAVKVVGVYAADNDGLKRMLKEGFENDLVPVDDWAMFAEGGGLKGVVDWLPIEAVVNAVVRLREIRDETIALLQRISGMADVMQGGLQNQYEGVGQTQIKAQFGSVRVQAMQDCFAGFAADLLQLKAEVICRHFQPEAIAKLSNMQHSHDAELLQPAIELLKSPEMAHIRVNVKPEQVAMVDYARLKVERTEFLTAMATFMQSAGPMLEKEPASMPTLLKMLQWTLSGFKGSSEIEGILDKAVEQAEQKAQQPQQDPAAQEAQAKAAELQAKVQGDIQKIQAKAQADMQTREHDKQADIQTTQANTQAKLQEIQAAHQANIRETQAKLQADATLAQIEGQMNIQQTVTEAETEMAKDQNEAGLSIEEMLAKAEVEMDQQAASLAGDMEKAGVDLGAKLTEIAAQGDKDDEGD